MRAALFSSVVCALLCGAAAYAPTGRAVGLTRPALLHRRAGSTALQADGEDDLLGSLKSKLGIEDKLPGEGAVKEGKAGLPIRMGGDVRECAQSHSNAIAPKCWLERRPASASCFLLAFSDVTEPPCLQRLLGRAQGWVELACGEPSKSAGGRGRPSRLLRIPYRQLYVGLLHVCRIERSGAY